MKKRFCFAAICISALVLGGCSLRDVKSWISANVLSPIRELLPKENEEPKKEDSKKEDQPSGEQGGQEEQGGEEQGGGEEQQHVHSTTASWSFDENGHYHICDECGEQFDNSNHELDDGVITTPATCTEDGVKTYSCSVCDYEITETIIASHDASGEYFYDDNNHWKVCGECGENILVGAHNYDEGTPIALPTKFETGITRYTCQTCPRFYDVETPKLDDTNLNVLFIGSALIRSNTGFTETFAGFANAMDARNINYTMENALTPSSGYSFNSLANENSGLGSTFRETLNENQYDIIVLQVTRMIAKGHDSVAAKELEALQSILSLLKGETSQI